MSIVLELRNPDLEPLLFVVSKVISQAVLVEGEQIGCRSEWEEQDKERDGKRSGSVVGNSLGHISFVCKWTFGILSFYLFGKAEKDVGHCTVAFVLEGIRVFISFSSKNLYEFSRAAVTNDHKLGDLKQHRFIIS